MEKQEQTGRSRLEKEDQASRKGSRNIRETELKHSKDIVGFEKEENLRNRGTPVEGDSASGTNRSEPAESDSRKRTRPVERGQEMFEISKSFERHCGI